MRASILALVFILPFVFSCKDNPGSGPAQVYYGEDVCERCKMIISEEAFSTQYVLSGGKSRKFDDPGCMIHYTSQSEEGGSEVDDIVAIYVKDYNSGEWIDGTSAYYVWSQNIKTPMGHGIIAVGDEKTARELSERESGEFLGGFNEASEFVNEEATK